ncbi:MAG: flagellar basal-body MS-ring/collar protein FliF [Bryobacteraceae bacterium]|jgi:flagellar M-ring protein FliF
MKSVFANLTLRQRVTIGLIVVAIAGSLYALVHWQKEADFKPLYTGLAPEDAGAIVQKLKESGVEYRLPESGGVILVPSARMAELRLNMATAGLPRSGRIGFELFDKANLGATEFTEHINYRRALEGELERSIMCLAEVEQARVHISFPKESVFLDSQEPAKASVLVKIRPGAHLAAGNVQAIDHLVASAVEGLAPDAVSVLDMNGNLLGRPAAAGGLDGPDSSEAALEYRHKVEADLLAKIASTLEPLLGAGKYRAGVSVECDFAAGDQSEELYDPAHSVMLTSQRSEDSTGSAFAAGVPGTPSSLPRPTSRPASGAGRNTRVTENITYQASRTVKKTHLPAGAVRRMSLAVLVDQDLTWQKDKSGYQRVLVPPSADKLKVVRDLVTGVTGFNAERGDQITIESLPFETTLSLEPPPPQLPAPPAKPAAPFGLPLDRKTLPMVAGAALGLLVLGFVAVRLLRGKKRALGGNVDLRQTLPAGPDGAQPTAHGLAAPGSNVEQQIESKLAERDAMQQKMEAQALNALNMAPVITKTAEVLAKHLREKIKQDPETPAQVLRTWIREEDM